MNIRPTTYLTLIILLAAMTLFWSCSATDDTPTVGTTDTDAGLTVSVPFITPTSRTYSDLDAEFQVNDLTLFFYKATGFAENGAGCVWRYDMPASMKFNSSTDGDRTLSFAIPMDVRNALFDGESTCVVYALANSLLISNREYLEAPSPNVAELRSMVSKVSFSQGSPEEFLMDALVTLPCADGKLSGKIELERLASRITLLLRIPRTITVNNNIHGTETQKEYRFITDGLESWISNGADKASLDLDASSVTLYSQTIESGKGTGFSPDGSGYTSQNGSVEIQNYLVSVPFYSYPRTWDPSDITDNTFLTLRADWESGGVRTPTYYKIPIRPSDGGLERNRSYDIGLTLGRLGSTDLQKPIEMTVEWHYNLEWNTKDFSTSIKELYYLILNNNDYDSTLGAYVYDINNGTEISIPFDASHDVEITNITIQWDDMKNLTNNTDMRSFTTQTTDSKIATFDGYSFNSSRLLGVSVDNPNSLLKFKRGLYHFAYSGSETAANTRENKVKVETATTPICPYVFTFDIRLKEYPSTTAKVIIRQYPAIYMTRVISDNNYNPTRFINSYSANLARIDRSGKGYVYSTHQENDIYYLGSVRTTESVQKNNNNRNVYTVHISKFSSLKDNYIIGDPRSTEVDNLSISPNLEGDWTKAGNTEKGNKYLTYYYPTRGDEDFSHFIAPSFSVASQWGMSQDMTDEQAKRRCASYQEYGKPAGRWRLPTLAEISFIADLSAKKLIPALFGNDKGENATYWAGSGAVLVNIEQKLVEIDENPSKIEGARCVYDDWYWQDDDCDMNTFTWGDRQRDLSRSRALLKKYTE